MKLKNFGLYFFVSAFLFIFTTVSFAASNYHGGWTQTTTSLDTDAALNGVSVVNSNVIWACGDNGKILETINGGTTWTQKLTPATTDAIVAIKAYDQNTVFAVSNIKLYVTTNEGASWQNTTTDPPIGMRAVDVIGTFDAIVVSGNPVNYNIGVTNYLGTPLMMNTFTIGGVDGFGIPVIAFYGAAYRDSNTAFVCGYNNDAATNVIYKLVSPSQIGGPTTTLVYNSGTQILNSIHFVDALNGWAVGNGGTILHTTDGGDTWSLQTSGVSVSLKDVKFISTNIGWAVGSEVILRTVDGGSTWTSQPVSLSRIVINGVDFAASPLKGFAVGNYPVSLPYERIYTSNSPTVTQVASSTAVVGTSGTFTISGANFEPESGVGISGSGVTLSSLDVKNSKSISGSGITINTTTVNSSNEISVGYTISSSASTGARSITVTNPDGSTGTKASAISIVSSPSVTNPTILSVSPESVTIGSATTMTITGTGFLSGATVSFDPATGISNTVSSVTSTSITMLTTVAMGTASGAVAITVTNTNGGNATKTPAFVKTAAGVIAPTLTSLSPSSITQGTSASYTITGTGFVAGATIAFSGSGVTAGTITSLTATEIVVPLTCDPTATISSRDLTVTNSDGGVAVKGSALNVVSATTADNPTITSVVEKTVLPGIIFVTINGTNFPYPLNGRTLAFNFGNGVIVASYTVLDTTKVVVKLVVDSSSSIAGDHDLILTVFDAFGSSTGSGSLAKAITVATAKAYISAKNPWKPTLADPNLVLKIYVPDAGSYTLWIVNGTSDAPYKVTFTFVAGLNEITINNNEYQFSAGIYSMQLVQGNSIVASWKQAIVY